MRRDNTPWQPIENAELDWSAPHSPRATRFDDVYFSDTDGMGESEYVFLQGNQLPARWATHSRPEFCILETGFGSALNFLLTWRNWRQSAQSRPRLHYISVEKYPLTAQDLDRVTSQWPDLADYARILMANYPHAIHGTHRLVFENGALVLDLWWEDIADALPDMAASERNWVDAWYLDGFAPARNQPMWSEALYTGMSQLSLPGATFATFTAASDVRRGLTKAGFEIDRAPGFGIKRECLRGTIKRISKNTRPTVTPWDIPRTRQPKPSSALIIGAGLAGCTTAAALVSRGIKVTVLEQNEIASAGSGNHQGILYTRMSSRHSALTDFSLSGFCFAHNFYRQLFETGKLVEGPDGALCGSFSQSHRASEMAELAPRLSSVPDLARVMTADQASAMLGIKQTAPGYWFPGSGWLRPAAVCRALLDHPDITVVENSGPIELQASGRRWLALASGGTVAEADCAVIATGTSANTMSGLSWLPLQPIRGQTSHLPASGAFNQLTAGFCHSGYICPDNGEFHCIGATFDPDDMDSEIRLQDHRRNLEALALAVPGWRDALLAINLESLAGRVSYRCATPDYLPVVGAVPNYDAFLADYGQLRRNAKRLIAQGGDYLPGLYLSSGHGSRGLTSTPIAAQVLASQICEQAQPLSRELQRAISPARFIIRRLSRGLI